MANTVLIQDLFESMPVNTDISGRLPPITESGQAWVRDTAVVSSDGAGNIKFATGSAIIKIRSLAEANVAVRAIWNDGGDSSAALVFLGDYTSSTKYPRNAYAAQFWPRNNSVVLYRVDGFSGIQIGPTIANAPWNALGADNTIVLQRAGNVFSAMVNGVTLSGSFTDATWSPDGTRKHHGLVAQGTFANTRLRSFEILDSVETAVSGETYTIVEVF